jgi:hypothetical protein
LRERGIRNGKYEADAQRCRHHRNTDGANIEIADAVGSEQYTAVWYERDAVSHLAASGYDPTRFSPEMNGFLPLSMPRIRGELGDTFSDLHESIAPHGPIHGLGRFLIPTGKQ